jgi:hypothetical protein
VTWEPNAGSTSLAEEALVAFEEQFADEGGVLVTFTKKPVITEDEAKKNYKGKGPPEPLVVSIGKGFLDLASLRKPEATQVDQRVCFEDVSSEVPLFQGRTYAHLSASLAPAITPVPRPRPTTQDIVPPLPPIPKFIPSKDTSEDFYRQARLAFKALSHEYYKTFELEEDAMQAEYKDRRKEHFLYSLNMSGKGNILKFKLKKSVVRLVKVLYPSLDSVKGLTFTQDDRLYTDIYGSLNDTAQRAIEGV